MEAPSQRSNAPTSSPPALRRMKSPVAGSLPKQPICGGAAGAFALRRQNKIGLGPVIHETAPPVDGRFRPCNPCSTLALALRERVADVVRAVRGAEEARGERVARSDRAHLEGDGHGG